MANKPKFHHEFRTASLPDENAVLDMLTRQANLEPAALARISSAATALVNDLRSSVRPGLMESFLAEYGLSTSEGVALMCLAEALLRVPDKMSIDALIEDKIAASNWRKHLGHSTSALVNVSTWGLMLTGKVLKEGEENLVGTLRALAKRLGEPVIRTAVTAAMREMGHQFVLGENITQALANAKTLEERGYTFSYDMLGEAAPTAEQANQYYLSYSAAISAIAKLAIHENIARNPGLSVKLSALHPRYEYSNRDRVMEELVPRVRALALLAKSAGIGLIIDAEEADRLSLSLEVIERVLSDRALKNWHGFGVVVQAYGLRAAAVLDWLFDLAERLDRKIMVRLVKGAYWDTEIKRAQVLGLDGFPVFSSKAATDVSFIACSRKLLDMGERIYPQFATHNAHSIAAIFEMAGERRDFEFQRLHGMGENLHEMIAKNHGTNCRIYAPVGTHRDLLAYLVRRLLENGANSSFVNQVIDTSVPAGEVAGDPFETIKKAGGSFQSSAITRPPALFGDARLNSRGWDLSDPADLAKIDAARTRHRHTRFFAGPMIAQTPAGAQQIKIINPYDSNDHVGTVTFASPPDIEHALATAVPWELDIKLRAEILNRAADLFEADFGVFHALAIREAGKTLPDAVSELREAVDFLRYYSGEAQKLLRPACGIVNCISPWNFPLAIFTGQIAAALAAGNGVLAKPAEQTPLIAARATGLLHNAGVPENVLQLLPGLGPQVGGALTSDPRVDGVCFTGSTNTAQIINRSMAAHLSPAAPLIAETGGLNAMIVDSTALHEQAVRDILTSAFQGAGQRCSALRILYVQRDIADDLCRMLFGAMDELRTGDPWSLATDIGPLIDENAARHINSYVEKARIGGSLLKKLPGNSCKNYVPPCVVQVNGIADLEEEIFGPVLHVAVFEANEIARIVADINAKGYGLTLAVLSRIDDRIQAIIDKLHVGNIYVNRNQIGATVGVQPFGGEGLSGTGPKAGGPNYLVRLTNPVRPQFRASAGKKADIAEVQSAIEKKTPPSDKPLKTLNLPGPTGEANRLSYYARGKILCLGPGKDVASAQASEAVAAGCVPIRVCEGGDVNGILSPADLTELTGFDAVIFWGPDAAASEIRIALAHRGGAILPLITGRGETGIFRIERHVCIDTTASGGNIDLLTSVTK